MKWHHGGIEVSSLKKSCGFYEEIFQFTVKECLILEDEKIIFMKRGSIILELVETGEESTGSSNMHFAWEVEDLPLWREHLGKFGLHPSEGPYHLDSGATVIFYEGPDGEMIELLSRG
ncbi:VOC family protein [Bacillus salacetis]|uniref:VOC family protein n=1 Tax=Bacillus salacetis TaxID=2315464 RepID=A0A3A1QPT8_9BACI|nr:VOC family protein [Bacillus salacetis]RIW29089.1 VOC family protein [Bacillus salacetis]